MSQDLADTSEQKKTKTLEEVAYKCFSNDEEVQCRNITFSVPQFCKPKLSVGDIRSSSMSCMTGTPHRLDAQSERLNKITRD